MKKSGRLLCVALAMLLATAGFTGCREAGEGDVSDISGISTTVGTATEASGDPSTQDSAATGDESTTAGSDKVTGNKTTKATNGKVTKTTTGKVTTTTAKGSSGKDPDVDSIVIDPNATKLKEQIVDMKGAKIVISSLWELLLMGTKNEKPPKKDDTGADTSNPKAIEEYKKVIAKIESDYNCDIVFKSPATAADMQTQVTKSAASGKAYADIMHVTPSEVFAFAPAGILADITNSPLSPKDPLWFSATTKFATLGGKVYGLDYISSNMGLPLRKCLFFNKKVLDTYAKGTDLYGMVKNGTWTWNAFTDLCNKVRSASGNKVGGIIAYDEPSLCTGWVASNGAYLAAPSGKTYAFSGTDEKTITALNYAAQIKSDGNLVAPDASQKENNRILIPFQNGKALFMMHHYYLAETNLSKNMKDDYGVLPVPKGPDAKKYYASFDDATIYTLNSYSEQVKNGNAQKILTAIALRTSMKNWKNYQQMNNLRDSQSVEMIELMFQNPLIDLTYRAVEFHNVVYPQLTTIVNGKITPSKAMQTVAGTAQAALKKIFES